MKRVPHAECEFPIFGVTLIPTGGQPFTEVSADPCWRGLEWDSWARIWPPPKGSATAPEVLVLYLKRPRAKNWELRRCGGALQIQH